MLCNLKKNCTIDTIDKLFGTEPLIAPELMDMIQTNGPPVQAKPCDVHSLGMTLAMTMMEYGAFTDIGDHGLMTLTNGLLWSGILRVTESCSDGSESVIQNT